MLFSLTDLSLIIASLALIVGFYSAWQINSLNKLRKGFFAGSGAVDLESVIGHLHQDLSDSQQRQEQLEKSLQRLHYALGFAVQKVGVVRFNPFNDSGGNFSFCLALLDEHNSGLVITSMHGRQQNRIYSKKIENGASTIKLNEEELQAVQEADQKYRKNLSDQDNN